MPILAVRDKDDIKKMHEAASTQFEHDLIETLDAWRWCYDAPIELIRATAQVILDDSNAWGTLGVGKEQIRNGMQTGSTKAQ